MSFYCLIQDIAFLHQDPYLPFSIKNLGPWLRKFNKLWLDLDSPHGKIYVLYLSMSSPNLSSPSPVQVQVQVQSKSLSPSLPSPQSLVHQISDFIQTSSVSLGSKPVNPNYGQIFALCTTCAGSSNTLHLGLFWNVITLYQLWILIFSLNWEFTLKGKLSSCSQSPTNPNTRSPVSPRLGFL